MPRMAASLLTHDDGSVGTITLNRPDAYNAITIELAQSLDHALRELAERVNVIVIRGAGENFSVGGDFKELERLRTRRETAVRELFVRFRDACSRIASVPVPVIAAVEGYAMAGGFELMQAWEFALVRSDARIADNHSNFGQVPSGGSSQRLSRLVGRQRALGLILTGDRLTGEEAAQWGLAYRAFAPRKFEEGVDEIVRSLAGKSREALARSKRLIYSGLEQELESGLELELVTVLDHVTGEWAGEGIASFARRGEKRA
jgi:enoyl-CoA hydratase/carnithine racemase